ncbi:sensor histidine kinase [Paenibacillus dakarensis]|uniref:sensor histidine kinase n=1 Tax=Paenibacillus dakarensis TaxID=1527293 RepID=UPI0006D58F41|nr:histidine kinase [Paenibacillus dakarensis]
MSYRTIKFLILVIPTLTIGIWEFVRHKYLLPYISMELGNWLAPLLVFLVSITLLLKLFNRMEELQRQLRQEQAAKAALEEREAMAKELHDGIAQSLFLLSVKVDRMKYAEQTEYAAHCSSLRKTVQEINEYVRQAISRLRQPAQTTDLAWGDSIRNLAGHFKQESGIEVELRWSIPEELLAAKEKVELYSSLQEGLHNIRKHAAAEQVCILGDEQPGGWKVRMTDNGCGYSGDPFKHPQRFGLQIMKERAQRFGWDIQLERRHGQTILTIEKRKG